MAEVETPPELEMETLDQPVETAVVPQEAPQAPKRKPRAAPKKRPAPAPSPAPEPVLPEPEPVLPEPEPAAGEASAALQAAPAPKPKRRTAPKKAPKASHEPPARWVETPRIASNFDLMPQIDAALHDYIVNQERLERQKREEVVRSFRPFN